MYACESASSLVCGVHESRHIREGVCNLPREQVPSFDLLIINALHISFFVVDLPFYQQKGLKTVLI